MSTGPTKDVWWHDAVDGAGRNTAEAFDSEHPLFILYVRHHG